MACPGAFWVIETNYDYALIYGCNERREDGACDVNAEFAYVISRRPTLAPPFLRRVNFIVRHRLCIDSSRFQFIEHSRTYHSTFKPSLAQCSQNASRSCCTQSKPALLIARLKNRFSFLLRELL